MPVDELERVRLADPVPSPPDPPPFADLERRRDDGQRRPARGARPAIRRLAVVALLAALVATGLGLRPSGQPDVLAAVFANTDPQRGTLHTASVTTRRRDGTLLSRTVETVWAQPSLRRSRTITAYDDRARGRVARHETVLDGNVLRIWGNREPNVIREYAHQERIALPDGDVGLLRWLYRSERLQLAGRASDGRWKLEGPLVGGGRLVALVDPHTLVPSEIRQQDRDGTVRTKRYTLFRREAGGIGRPFAAHPGLPVRPSRELGARPRATRAP